MLKVNEIIYGQLLAMRLQIDSLIQMVEGSIVNSEECKEIQCNHPENMKVSYNTMGDDREKFYCKNCGKKFIDNIEVENF